MAAAGDPATAAADSADAAGDPATADSAGSPAIQPPPPATADSAGSPAIQPPATAGDPATADSAGSPPIRRSRRRSLSPLAIAMVSPAVGAVMEELEVTAAELARSSRAMSHAAEALSNVANRIALSCPPAASGVASAPGAAASGAASAAASRAASAPDAAWSKAKASAPRAPGAHTSARESLAIQADDFQTVLRYCRSGAQDLSLDTRRIAHEALRAAAAVNFPNTDQGAAEFEAALARARAATLAYQGRDPGRAAAALADAAVAAVRRHTNWWRSPARSRSRGQQSRREIGR